MRRTRWARAGRAGKFCGVLGLAVLALTGCSAGDIERNFRFGWPTGATRQATEMRVLWTWAGISALALGIIVWGLIFWCCIRYRKRSEDQIPRQTKYNALVEGVCVFFPFLIIAALFYRTVVVEDNVNDLSRHPDVSVQVDAFKWNWQFEYHSYRGAQGTGASPAQEVYTDGSDRPMRDPNDPKRPYYLSTVGSSDLIPVLVIPVGQTVQIDEHSEDVIHSFWVPDFLFKRDVIPYGSDDTSRDNKFQFTATKTGSFVGRCAELCGTYHSQMNFEVRVVSQDTFTNYLSALKQIGPDDAARQQKALKIAMPDQSAYATTTYPFTTDRNTRAASQRSGS